MTLFEQLMLANYQQQAKDVQVAIDRWTVENALHDLAVKQMPDDVWTALFTLLYDQALGHDDPVLV